MAMSERLVKKRSKKMAYQKSILSAVDFLVNRLASPVAEKGKKMTATYGLRCFALWEKSSRGGYWAKMLQDSCQLLMFPGEEGELLEPFSTTWPRWGIVSDGRAMELAISGRRTKETGCLFWPTPHANCHTGAGEHGDGGDNLQTVVKLWGTPTACSYKGSSLYGSKRHVEEVRRGNLKGEVMEPNNAGQLNSDWVECLMGFPEGWTDIDYENVKAWHGWPAPLGNGDDWMTPTTPSGGKNIPEDAIKRCNTIYRKDGRKVQFHLENQVVGISPQYSYEPPRVIQGQKNRAKRLKCLGNAVVPQQVYPIFAAIAEIEGE